MISIRVQMLAAVFNKKCSDELLSVFKEAMNRFPIAVLKAAFHRAEQNLDRFPTPKTMLTLCGEACPSDVWRYHYAKLEAQDPETGAPIVARRDPENGDTLYRAGDCPEGRAFLARLRSIAGKAA